MTSSICKICNSRRAASIEELEADIERYMFTRGLRRLFLNSTVRDDSIGKYARFDFMIMSQPDRGEDE